VDICSLSLQQEEVSEVKWVDKAEVLRMMEVGIMVPYYFIDKLFDIKNQYGANAKEKCNIQIKYASMEQLESWMNLVSIVKYNFPGLETQQGLNEYRDTVVKNIHRKSAICATEGNVVVGILLFSTKYNMLCCMAVHPEYRRKHIADHMIALMLENLDRNKDIVVDTFREEDQKGKAARALYKKLGFVEGELTVNFGYPNQRFVLKKTVCNDVKLEVQEFEE
jgi:ribosomal protein S18 acetylase RimI-like enzyme